MKGDRLADCSSLSDQLLLHFLVFNVEVTVKKSRSDSMFQSKRYSADESDLALGDIKQLKLNHIHPSNRHQGRGRVNILQQ